jgi:hypothetical protein
MHGDKRLRGVTPDGSHRFDSHENALRAWVLEEGITWPRGKNTFKRLNFLQESDSVSRFRC